MRISVWSTSQRDLTLVTWRDGNLEVLLDLQESEDHPGAWDEKVTRVAYDSQEALELILSLLGVKLKPLSLESTPSSFTFDFSVLRRLFHRISDVTLTTQGNSLVVAPVVLYGEPAREYSLVLEPVRGGWKVTFQDQVGIVSPLDAMHLICYFVSLIWNMILRE